MTEGRCPTCNSPSPGKHPATGFEGEVQVCVDGFHTEPRMGDTIVATADRLARRMGARFVLNEDVDASGDLHALVQQRDEADRRAGSAERRNAELLDERERRAKWLSKAKRDAGYDDNVSFDRVWATALAALIEQRAQPPAVNGMPAMDHGMRTTVEGALEIVLKRDPGMVGLILNLRRLQEWLDLYAVRAKQIGAAADVDREARFLCERLREFAPSIEEDARQYCGHILPAVARLESLLALIGGGDERP